MAQAKYEELAKDLDEAKKLFETAERTRVKDALAILIRKVESDIILMKEEENKKKMDEVSSATKDVESKPKVKNICYDVKITNYAWDQNDKSLKFYITLKDVHSLPKENVVCNFTTSSLELVVNGLAGYNHSLVIKNLLHPIVPESSSYRVKTDTVVVILRKENSQNWSQITVQEKKVKDLRTPKLDESADPSQGLMDMLKQMYEDGDDDMKRTIAKAWTESQGKPGGMQF